MNLNVLRQNEMNSDFSARNNLRSNPSCKRTKAYQNDAFSLRNRKDQKLSSEDAIKSFAKGVISPITGMFKSTKSFAVGVGTVAASTALVVATGGAAAPLLVAAGLGIGAFQAVNAISLLSKAKTKKQKENAIFEAGAATGTIGLSLIGSKTSIKQAGESTEGLNIFSASAKAVKETPKSIKASYTAFKEGYYKDNVRSALKPITAKAYQTELSKEIFQNVNKNFEQDINAIRNILPDNLKESLIARVKSQSSSYDKLINRSNFDKLIQEVKNDNSLSETQKAFKINKINKDKDLFLSNKEYAKSKVDDQNGTRLEINSNFDDVVHGLASAIKNGDFDVVCIKNYRNPHNSNSAYFTPENIEELQEASSKLGRRISINQDNIKKSGYCSAQIKIKFKSGVLGELQIRGKNVGEIAELEHFKYDIESNKDIFKGKTELIKLFGPYKKALKNLSPEQKKAYDAYFVELYEWARDIELGAKTPKPQLPAGLDKTLDVANIKTLYSKTHNTNIVQDNSHNLLPEVSFLYGISSDEN